MASEALQQMLEELIPYFKQVKQDIEATLTPNNTLVEIDDEELDEDELDEEEPDILSEEDDAASSHSFTPPASMFDGSEDSASSTGTSEVSVADPAPVVQATVVQVTAGYTMKDLTHLIRFIAMRVTPDELQKLYFDSGLGPVALPKFVSLTLKTCVISGAQHNFAEDSRYVRCEKQLCIDCRQSFLSHCTRHTSSHSAALAGAHRHNSLPAMRVTSTCRQPACKQRHVLPKARCICMDKLLSATSAVNVNIEGFYHCGDCIASVLVEMAVPNMTQRVFSMLDGLEVLAEYVCPCGNPAATDISRICKLCLGVCRPYTVNAFDLVFVHGQFPRAAMRSLNWINEGVEGRSDWNNGEVLWWVNS